MMKSLRAERSLSWGMGCAPVTTWTVAGSGLPMVEVPGVTIMPGARLFCAVTHGRRAWMLQLP